MKKLATILFLTLSITAISQKGRENNPGKTETTQTTASNPNSSGQINLISPADTKQLDAGEINKPILFRWAPVVPRPQGPVTYRLRVWQLMQGQNGTQAMSSNQPVITKDVSNVTQASVTVLTGPCKPPYLCDFVWVVEALNSNDKESGKAYGRSGAFSFTIGEVKALNAQGDPIHGVDIKLGFETACVPIHGGETRIGVIAKDANGDPVHDIDIKLGSTIKATTANGDPVHGIDIKLGAVTKSVSANGDPVHGIDIKLGAIAKANGDPVHGIDIKLGFEGKKEDVDKIQTVELIVTTKATNANGDPVHGIDIKLGAVAKKANGDPVHGIDIKLGVRSVSANGDPVHGIDIKLGVASKKQDKELDKNQPNAKIMHTDNGYHPVSLPIEKVVYDKAGNIVEIVLKPENGNPKYNVTWQVSGEPPVRTPPCRTVYCHNPLHPPGCGWLECK